GDELHNRIAAATSMLAERLAPGLARAHVAADVQERLFGFLGGNPQFFVAVSLAASKLMLDAGHGVEGSTLVTAMGANGRDCGIKVSGLGDEWFTAPAEMPEGAGAQDAGPACGGSAPACSRPHRRSGRRSASTRHVPASSTRARAESRSRSTPATACPC